jgi:hypothetical protein
MSTRATGSQTARLLVEDQPQSVPITYGSLTNDQKEELRNLQSDF